MAYFVGLDLGQSADYTALAIMQTVHECSADARRLEKCLHLRHLERFPLKTPYTEVADHVRDFLNGPPLTEDQYDPSRHRIAKPKVELLVDKTGVGVAVTDLLKERRLRFTSITVTGMGKKVTHAGKGACNVPKMDLWISLRPSKCPFIRAS